MEFKYSLSLLCSNLGYVLKILVWVLICLLIAAAIGAAVLIPTCGALARSAAVADAYAELAEGVQSFLDGDMSIRTFISQLTADISALSSAVSHSAGLLAAVIILAIFVYVLYTFLIYISYYPTSYIINQLMSSNMRLGFASSMAMNFKTAVKFALCRVSIAAPIDIALMVISGGLFMGLVKIVGVFAFPVTLAFGIFVFSMRATMLAGWLPRMLFNPGENIYTAFARSLRSVKLNFNGLAKAFLISFFMTYALVAGLGIPTFGLIAIAVPSVNYFLFKVIELVGYYKMNGLSFYTDAATVVNTVEFGYRAENQHKSTDIVGIADADMTVSAYRERLEDIKEQTNDADNGDTNDDGADR